MIEHVISALMEDLEERRYRAYLTDALMIITENTARGVQGKYLTKRWADKFVPVDSRTCDEIAADVIRNAGLVVKDGEINGLNEPCSAADAGQKQL